MVWNNSLCVITVRESARPLTLTHKLGKTRSPHQSDASPTNFCGRPLWGGVAIRRRAALRIGFHAFLQTDEMSQVRAAHFVGDPVADPVVSVLHPSRARDAKTFLDRWFSALLDYLPILFPGCGQESFFTRTVITNFAPRSTTWCVESSCRHCRLHGDLGVRSHRPHLQLLPRWQQSTLQAPRSRPLSFFPNHYVNRVVQPLWALSSLQGWCCWCRRRNTGSFHEKPLLFELRCVGCLTFPFSDRFMCLLNAGGLDECHRKVTEVLCGVSHLTCSSAR